jgi:hypothetical protein
MSETPPDECPNCGAEIKTWREEVEYGGPTNTDTIGAVAPNYKTKTVTVAACIVRKCGWREHYE